MKSRYNIIFLLADQHRYDCTGAAGLCDIKTPNLDYLASKGTFFTNAYTPMPVCAPARQCLTSGLMADSFGGFWNYDMRGLPCKSMVNNGLSWSNRMDDNGYNLAFLGKWHVSETEGAEEFGYSKVIGNETWDKYINEKYSGKTYEKGFSGEESFIKLNDSRTHFMAQKAAGLIDEYSKADTPFFIQLDYSDPHLPCRPSTPFARMYDKNKIKPWQSFNDTFENKPYIYKQMILNWHNEDKSWDDWAETVSLYYGMISQIDDSIGIIINALKKQRIFDETVIIYTSDHGDTCGGHGMTDKHYILYDDNCRVPLIIYHPLYAKGNINNDFISNMLDLTPTIEEISGTASVGERHGLSLVPLLTGEMQPQRDDFVVSSSNGQQFGFYCNRSIRTENYRYVWNLTDIDELYDIKNDPGELINIIKNEEYSHILRELREKLYNKLIFYNDPFASGWVGKQLTEGRKLS